MHCGFLEGFQASI